MRRRSRREQCALLSVWSRRFAGEGGGAVLDASTRTLLTCTADFKLQRWALPSGELLAEGRIAVDGFRYAVRSLLMTGGAAAPAAAAAAPLCFVLIDCDAAVRLVAVAPSRLPLHDGRAQASSPPPSPSVYSEELCKGCCAAACFHASRQELIVGIVAADGRTHLHVYAWREARRKCHKRLAIHVPPQFGGVHALELDTERDHIIALVDEGIGVWCLKTGEKLLFSPRSEEEKGDAGAAEECEAAEKEEDEEANAEVDGRNAPPQQNPTSTARDAIALRASGALRLLITHRDARLSVWRTDGAGSFALRSRTEIVAFAAYARPATASLAQPACPSVRVASVEQNGALTCWVADGTNVLAHATLAPPRMMAASACASPSTASSPPSSPASLLWFDWAGGTRVGCVVCSGGSIWCVEVVTLPPTLAACQIPNLMERVSTTSPLLLSTVTPLSIVCSPTLGGTVLSYIATADDTYSVVNSGAAQNSAPMILSRPESVTPTSLAVVKGVLLVVGYTSGRVTVHTLPSRSLWRDLRISFSLPNDDGGGRGGEEEALEIAGAPMSLDVDGIAVLSHESNTQKKKKKKKKKKTDTGTIVSLVIATSHSKSKLTPLGRCVALTHIGAIGHHTLRIVHCMHGLAAMDAIATRCATSTWRTLMIAEAHTGEIKLWSSTVVPDGDDTSSLLAMWGYFAAATGGGVLCCAALAPSPSATSSTARLVEVICGMSDGSLQRWTFAQSSAGMVNEVVTPRSPVVETRELHTTRVKLLAVSDRIIASASRDVIVVSTRCEFVPLTRHRTSYMPTQLFLRSVRSQRGVLQLAAVLSGTIVILHNACGTLDEFNDRGGRRDEGTVTDRRHRNGSSVAAAVARVNEDERALRRVGRLGRTMQKQDVDAEYSVVNVNERSFRPPPRHGTRSDPAAQEAFTTLEDYRAHAEEATQRAIVVDAPPSSVHVIPTASPSPAVELFQSSFETVQQPKVQLPALPRSRGSTARESLHSSGMMRPWTGDEDFERGSASTSGLPQDVEQRLRLFRERSKRMERLPTVADAILVPNRGVHLSTTSPFSGSFNVVQHQHREKEKSHALRTFDAEVATLSIGPGGRGAGFALPLGFADHEARRCRKTQRHVKKVQKKHFKKQRAAYMEKRHARWVRAFRNPRNQGVIIPPKNQETPMERAEIRCKDIVLGKQPLTRLAGSSRFPEFWRQKSQESASMSPHANRALDSHAHDDDDNAADPSRDGGFSRPRSVHSRERVQSAANSVHSSLNPSRHSSRNPSRSSTPQLSRSGSRDRDIHSRSSLRSEFSPPSSARGSSRGGLRSGEQDFDGDTASEMFESELGDGRRTVNSVRPAWFVTRQQRREDMSTEEIEEEEMRAVALLVIRARWWRTKRRVKRRASITDGFINLVTEVPWHAHHASLPQDVQEQRLLVASAVIARYIFRFRYRRRRAAERMRAHLFAEQDAMERADKESMYVERDLLATPFLKDAIGDKIVRASHQMLVGSRARRIARRTNGCGLDNGDEAEEAIEAMQVLESAQMAQEDEDSRHYDVALRHKQERDAQELAVAISKRKSGWVARQRQFDRERREDREKYRKLLIKRTEKGLTRAQRATRGGLTQAQRYRWCVKANAAADVAAPLAAVAAAAAKATASDAQNIANALAAHVEAAKVAATRTVAMTEWLQIGHVKRELEDMAMEDAFSAALARDERARRAMSSAALRLMFPPFEPFQFNADDVVVDDDEGEGKAGEEEKEAGNDGIARSAAATASPTTRVFAPSILDTPQPLPLWSPKARNSSQRRLRGGPQIDDAAQKRHGALIHESRQRKARREQSRQRDAKREEARLAAKLPYAAREPLNVLPRSMPLSARTGGGARRTARASKGEETNETDTALVASSLPTKSCIAVFIPLPGTVARRNDIV